MSSINNLSLLLAALMFLLNCSALIFCIARKSLAGILHCCSAIIWLVFGVIVALITGDPVSATSIACSNMFMAIGGLSAFTTDRTRVLASPESEAPADNDT